MIDRIKELLKQQENFPLTYDIELHKKYLEIESELDDLIFQYLLSKGVNYNEESYKLIRELIK
jgi:hypothetical protein